MLRRTRTTKKLAKRIDLQYFAHPHPFRSWRFWLSVAVPLLATAWFITQRAQGGQKAYSSGQLSHAHAVFTQQCALCHVTQAGAFTAHVTDKACLACHDAPLHHANQTFTPECATCHVEHKGAMLLQATTDAACTQCHAQLRTRDGQSHYVANITSFENKHPEFAPLRSGQADASGVRLNHYVHLQPNLMGPNNTRVQMTCDDCHRAAGGGNWPYGAEMRPVAVNDANPGRPHGKAYMPVPEFAKHCAACHTLQFDKRFGNEQVPHDKPEVVHAFLMKRFVEYIAAHPAAVHEVETPDRQLPERVRLPRVARNAAEWIQFRVDDAEWLLYAKTCKQCHTLTPASGPLPEVAKSNLTARWLAHAEFDHHAHRMMSCTACHIRTPDSRETADVLLPGIQTCQECHRENKPTEAAEGRCFECHQYHDWTKAKPTKGGFTIQQLRGDAKTPVPSG
ncbi:MAG: cytochrome c3 family protein [Acidobacteriia bacterium]|nr:cytochrome c3 family protein [Terriglobia bacterium]